MKRIIQSKALTGVMLVLSVMATMLFYAARTT